MRISSIIFMGTPEFAVPALDILCDNNYRPSLVITQPDKPKGRKRKLAPPEVKIRAQFHDIPVFQPHDINSDETVNFIKKISPDLIVTAAYGGYLKRKIRKIPILGCINLHPSLLPKYRGSSPLNYALFNGDTETGITIFKIVAKMDAGPIIYQKKYEIFDNENYTSLYNRMALNGAKDLLNAIKLIETEEVKYIKQNSEKATFSLKIEKEDLLLDWNNTAISIHNKVRGLSEKPGIISSFRGKRIKIIKATVTNNKSTEPPGTVVDIKKNIGIFVATKDNILLLNKLQPEGKKVMTSSAFNLGARIKIGELFENGF